MSSDHELYRLLFTQHKTPTLLLQDHTITAANARALTLFGCEEEELTGQSLQSLFSPEQPDGRSAQEMLTTMDQVNVSCSCTCRFQPPRERPFLAATTITRIPEATVAQMTIEPLPADERPFQATSLAIFSKITALLYRSSDLDSVVERAIDAIMEYSQAPSVALFTYEPGASALVIRASRGFSQATLEAGSELPIAGSLTGITVSRKEIVTTDQLAHDDRIEPEVKQALLKQGFTGSVISVPLLLQEQVVGAMNLIYSEIHPLTTTEKETLLAIGAAIALAIANANYVTRIEAEIAERERAEKQIRNRHELTQAFSQARTEQEVTKILVEKASRIPETAVFVTLCVGENNHVISRRHLPQNDLNGPAFPPVGMHLTPGIFPTIKQFRPERPFISDDLLAHPQIGDGFQALARRTKARSMAVLPLTSSDDWTGNLMLFAPEPNFFTADKLAAYDDLVSQGATALHAAKLSTHIQESLERRSREVELTTRVAQEVAAATSLDELYERVVNQVKEQFDYYHTQLLRYDPALDNVVLVLGYGQVGQKMLSMHHSMPIGVGLIGKAAATGQSTLRADVTADPSWQPNSLLPHTKGELAVPIKLGDEVLGVLDVQSDQVGALNEEDQLLLEGLCGQIAIAIESTRLRQEMEDRLRELNTLQRFMSREGWQTYHDKQTRPDGFRFEHGTVHTISTPVDDADTAPANGRSPQGTGDSHPTVGIPLEIRGEQIGTLGVTDDPERPLSTEDKQFLRAVSEQVAEALEIARLFEQTQDSLTEQERLAAELRTVAQVSTAASTILDVDRLLHSVVDLVKASFGLYHAHVYLLDEESRTLRLKAGAGNVGQIMVLEKREISLNADSLVARAARTRRGFIENDVRKIVDFLPHPLLPETRAEMALPLIIGSKLLGILDLQSDRVNFFSEDDMQVQRILAAQIAVAVQNARLYAEQVEITAKLRELDKLKSEFLASMSHELRTPLNSIIGFADVLLEGIDGELNKRMEEDVRLIRSSGHHLRELIGDILDMSKIEAGRMELRYETIDMEELAKDIMATAQPLAQEKSLGLQLEMDDELKPVTADRTRLRQVLWNIVGNAIKFTSEGEVTVKIHTNAEELSVSVRDTGIGIKTEHIPIVFEQFRQIDGSLNRTSGGTGLGLPISKKLIELHGGTIGVDSELDKGSTFWFRIPRHQHIADAVASATG